MKAGLVLLLATVVPFGWVFLGGVLLWRFVAPHRSPNSLETNIAGMFPRVVGRTETYAEGHLAQLRA